MARKILKWIGIGVGGLLVLLVGIAGVLYLIGSARVNQTYRVPVENISIPTDAASVERGKHLAGIFLCTRCHQENLGGELYFDVPGMITIPTPNLTRGAGGVGGSLTDEDWVRAIRHGVDPTGRRLDVMMSAAYQYLSAEDIGAIVAYAKSVPPVDNPLPQKSVAPLGRVLMGAGMFPPAAVSVIDHNRKPPPAPPVGATVEYGEYLTHPCTECHGPKLNGMPFGPPGQEVPTPNLTPGGELVGWTEPGFSTTLRTGKTPSGRELSVDMPWKSYAQLTDDELKAVWLYLRSLPALEQAK